MDIAFCEDGILQISALPGVESFCQWVQQNAPRLVAIDAPSKRNCGRVALTRAQYGIPNNKYEDFRVVEAFLRLKGIGLYNTPLEDPPAWMNQGWQLYQSLEELGYQLLDEPGPTEISDDERVVIEVHPHASFVVGLGWIPQDKKGLAGQLERMAYLRTQCAEMGINVAGTCLADDPLTSLQQINATWDGILVDGLKLPSISHDQLDAVVGLTTVLRAANGQAFAVGDSADGVIVLPNNLAGIRYHRL